MRFLLKTANDPVSLSVKMVLAGEHPGFWKNPGLLALTNNLRLLYQYMIKRRETNTICLAVRFRVRKLR